MLTTIHIGNIDPAVSTDESVLRLRDQYPVPAADHGAALAQRELDDAGIERILLCPLKRFSRGFHCGQIDQPPLSLRNNLVFNDKNVAGLKLDALPSHRFE